MCEERGCGGRPFGWRTVHRGGAVVARCAGADAETDYALIELGADVSGISLMLGVESLGSDDGTAAFQTPLATKHKFQGWADQFLLTPNAGVVDTYFTVGGKVAGIKLSATYHDYEADEDSPGLEDLGDEINLLAVKKFSNGIVLGTKYAAYSAGDTGFGKVDVDKFWLWTEVSF